MQKKYIISCIYMLLCSTLIAAESLTSPDGNLKLLFSLSKQGEPVYELFYKSKVVIKPSKLGIEIKNDKGSVYQNNFFKTYKHIPRITRFR